MTKIRNKIRDANSQSQVSPLIFVCSFPKGLLAPCLLAITKKVNISDSLDSPFQTRLTFEGVRGSSWSGDIAIDDVSIRPGSCSGIPPSPVPPTPAPPSGLPVTFS